MNRGYVKLWRTTGDSGIMDNPEVCRLFLFLLLRASVKPRTVMIGNSPVALEPGQIVIGRRKLAADLGTTEWKTRASLAALEAMKLIRQQTASRFSIVSFENWEQYQNVPDASEPQVTGRFSESIQQTATNKERKENKNIYTRKSQDGGRELISNLNTAARVLANRHGGMQ